MKYKHQFFRKGQSFVGDVNNSVLLFSVQKVDIVDLDSLSSNLGKGFKKNNDNSAAQSSTNNENELGAIIESTIITCQKEAGANLTLKGGNAAQASIFKPNYDFQSLGIGGMAEEFHTLFRRAFAPRVINPAIMAKLGITPVKGILLYGPPGTGKTLMARQIGQMLNGKEPVIVNGPEILDKMVGESERKVRELFAPAEAEWKEKGAASELHIIVLDELDAICKRRGTGSTGGSGVGDTVVNQLLSIIDGYRQMSNFLVIGMTNRKDMIDPAFLRPGRLEVHIEISLPDEAGRLEILQIHTATMVKSGLLDSSVSLPVLAANTKNYSGSELMGLVQNASTYAMNRHIDMSDPTNPFNEEEIRVTKPDFDLALAETTPSFGVAETSLSNFIRCGICMFSPAVKDLSDQLFSMVEQVKRSDKTKLLSVLLCGPPGCGKSAFAAHIGLNSTFPFVKVITPEDYIGWHEIKKVEAIAEIFYDAYRSPLSFIIIDDIERILEYVSIGPRFSNVILQALLVSLNKLPPNLSHKLFILGTTSQPKTLAYLGFNQIFRSILSLPLVSGSEEIAKVLTDVVGYSKEEVTFTKQFDSLQVPIKTLINLGEHAKYSDQSQLSTLLSTIPVSSTTQSIFDNTEQ